MEQKNTFFDSKEYLKYLTGLLIFLGLIKNSYFYSFFGINIIDYIGVSEVLMSLLDLWIIVVAVVYFLLFSFLGIKLLSAVKNSDVATVLTSKDQAQFKRKTKLNFKFIEWSCLIMFIVCGVTSCYLIKESEYFEFSIYLFFSLFAFSHFFLSAVFPNLLTNKKFEYFINGYFIIGFAISCIIIPTGWRVNQIKHGYKFFGTEIYLDKEKIVCDSNNNYVGQTKDFIFLYSLKTNSNTVIPKSKVERIIFKNN